MGEYDSLGRPRGSRGVHDDGRVLRGRSDRLDLGIIRPKLDHSSGKIEEYIIPK